MNIAFYTLGCKLNFSETSHLINDVKKHGYKEVSFKEHADIYVINTCSVTENANSECKYLVRKVLRKNPNAKVVVIGCYAQLKPLEISKIQGVSLVLGNNEKFKLIQYLKRDNKEVEIFRKKPSELIEFKSSYSSSNRTRSFLKVQDGCSYKCSFCTIPMARGRSRNDKIGNIIQRIKKIRESGVKEIVLTGINIGDFKTEKNENFFDLLKEIDKLKNIRIRISSIEPNLISDKIIDLISKSNVFVPHFHIPLQSGSDKILNKMKRRYLSKYYSDLIKKINSKIKNVCIGVDVIVGFPGESETLFNETVDFIKSMNVSYLHVFSFSERENTPAKQMNNKVPIEIKKYRSKVLRNLSEKKKRFFYQKNIGKIKKVLFENDVVDGHIFGYTENYIKVKYQYDSELINKVKKIKLIKIDNENSSIAKGEITNIKS
tara:strand:+ start:1704 stop:2999 length:1296 start_codon:yes stop_codon:yes gene_type:complete